MSESIQMHSVVDPRTWDWVGACVPCLLLMRTIVDQGTVAIILALLHHGARHRRDGVLWTTVCEH